MVASGPLCASAALVAYAESLIEGGRVIVFGDSLSGLADRFVERGARLVHVVDADPARVAEAATRNSQRNVSFAPLVSGGLGVREGAFDVAVVTNLGASSAAQELIQQVERVLSNRGVALLAAPNTEVTLRLIDTDAEDALDYYELYDCVADRFEHVRMLGQAPFVGYAVVDFGSGDDPVPTFDTAFVPGGAEEAEWFIALASHRPLELDDFAVIQLPLAEVRVNDDDGMRKQLAQARAAERTARDRMASLEAALSARSSASAEPQELARLQKQIAKNDHWIQELERRATAADARADEALVEIERLQAELARTHSEERKRQESVEQARQRTAELAQRLSALEGIEKSSLDDVSRLEAQLHSRAQEIERLEATLREATRAGRELLLRVEDLTSGQASTNHEASTDPAEADLGWSATMSHDGPVSDSPVEKEEPPSPEAPPSDSAETGGESAEPGAGDLRRQLEAIAAREARLAADLTAAEWIMGRLCARLEEDSATRPVAELARALVEARARLQSQAVLLEQHRAAQPAPRPAAPESGS